MGRASGISEEQLAALADHARSPHFSAEEKLVLRYAEAMTKTPVDVPDELFASLRAKFDEPAIVELTSSLAWENYRARFDHALGIESAGLSEGASCVLGQRPPESAQPDAAPGYQRGTSR